MSKELETLYIPLQCLNNIRDNYFLLKGKGGTDLEYRWFNRIETALKTLEIIKKLFKGHLNIDYDKNHDFYEIWISTEYEDIVIASGQGKEEFDLLKEVLS